MMLRKICEDFLDEAMELFDVPGIALGVLRGEESFTGARGVRDILTKDPLQADDIFHCASASKLFTSEAVMKLAEAGALDLEEHLSDVLPDLAEKMCIADKRCAGIQLLHMLTHTSGISHPEQYHWDQPQTGASALADYSRSPEAAGRKLLHAPGEGGFHYSDTAYDILGQIVSERAPAMTGGEKISYEEFIRRFLLQPAGMTASTMLTFERFGVPEGAPCPRITDEIRDRNAAAAPGWRPMALPHEMTEDRRIRAMEYYPYSRIHTPSSTLTSNAGDMLKWARINMKGFAAAEAADAADAAKAAPDGKHAVDDETPAGLLMHPETYRMIRTEYAEVPNNREKMGLGWFMRRQDGYQLYGHEGSDDGFRSSFWICPETETAIVVLSNLTGAPVKKLNRKLFTRIMEG